MKKKDKNKRKRILKCEVGLENKIKYNKNGCNWDLRLGRGERREERGERGGRNKREKFRNVKCYISKNGVTNSN